MLPKLSGSFGRFMHKWVLLDMNTLGNKNSVIFSYKVFLGKCIEERQTKRNAQNYKIN